MTRSQTAGPSQRPIGVKVASWVRLLRPAQWVKNAFVFAPLLFSGRAGEPEAILRAAAAALAFCLAASAVYALNDVRDREEDRLHPRKRERPLASGAISPRAALGSAVLLATAGVAMAASIAVDLVTVVMGYLLLNLLYTWKLKQIVLIDVFVLASFFLLRLLAGAVAISVQPSIWLLLCGGLLALYLGFAKRRHELLLLGDDSTRHREVLAHYSPLFLDQMSVVLLSVTIVAYIMYTLTSRTAALVGSESLAYSTVFVLYGVFRYLYLVHERQGGNPTDTLLTDRWLLANVVLWLVYCGWVIYRPF